MKYPTNERGSSQDVMDDKDGKGRGEVDVDGLVAFNSKDAFK